MKKHSKICVILIFQGRVMELEEELEQLRPGSKQPPKDEDESKPEPPQAKSPEEDLPVYGPLPREPEEKLFPWKYERKESGVRKLWVLISLSKAKQHYLISTLISSDIWLAILFFAVQNLRSIIIVKTSRVA